MAPVRQKAVREQDDELPVVVPIYAQIRIRPERAAQIIESYETNGYALFQFERYRDLSGALVGELAADLDLGPPFVPPLYMGRATAQLYDAFGVNTVKVSDGGSAVHPVFESRNDLRLHTDGTLQALGEIRSALLICVSPAYRGGETVIFQAADVFVKLLKEEPRLAAALLHPRALTRWTTVAESRLSCTGPVFAWEHGEILSRYSVTENDEWCFADVPNLQDAHRYLDTLSRAPSPYLVRVKLQAGQGILLANDRVSHGRTAFVDSGPQTRHMLRALFTARPGMGMKLRD
jgi:alpha-ketoglutarate-dependent taurine dioxygenase